ncbi:DNA polymerase Y family protein [Yimella sp. RIT 621]|nr:DNA polymerase Y family protein [Yimella sp. RIT 621]
MFDTRWMTASIPLSTRPARALVVWCPNWSIEAVRRSMGSAAPSAFALVRAGRLVAVCETAAQEAVTVGLRVREAQVRCPNLVVLQHDPALDERRFAPVLRAVEKLVPHMQVLRPGTIAMRIAGASRFYGSEDAVVESLFDQLSDTDVPDARIAVAEGLFAAEQAAYATTPERPFVNLSADDTHRFLRTLPVEAVAQEIDQLDLAKTLRRMGIRNLGGFARLPRQQVHARFGEGGLRAHRLASGQDAPLLRTSPVPTDLSVRAVCDPPATDTATITHWVRVHCEQLTERLRRAGQVCHEIRVELRTEAGVVHERRWRHTWPFGVDDMVERVRWQLDDFDAEQQTRFDAISSVAVAAESPTAASEHAQGLWGERPDRHIVHALTSLQHELGHSGVCSATLVGGRLLHERQAIRPWGDAAPAQARLEQPWPGTVPGPAPATVFRRARPAEVSTDDGEAVGVDSRGNLSRPPTHWRPAHDRSPRRRIVAWNGPWPLRQHWWQKPLQVNRFQIIDDASQAWLLIAAPNGWWIEARYD